MCEAEGGRITAGGLSVQKDARVKQFAVITSQAQSNITCQLLHVTQL